MRGILRTPVGKKITEIWEHIKNRRYYFLFAAIAVLVLYALGITISLESVQAIVIISILFILASFSTMYKRYFRAPPVFELMTFGVVVVTIKYGLLAGIIFGAVSQIASEIISGAIDAQIIIFVPARALLAVWTAIAVSLGVNSLFAAGMIAIITYNLMVQPISFFVGDMQLKAKTVYYTIGYTLMNFFLFSIFSGPVQSLLGLF